MSARLLRKHASAIFKAALRAADPSHAVEARLARIDFDQFRNIYVVGAGKAGASMANAAERILGARIAAGYLNVKYGHSAPKGATPRRIQLNECGHPEPDARGMAGAERIAEIASSARRGDLVLCLISGGASALMPLPASPVTLEEKREVTKLLLRAGADIHEFNTVRKHLSRIKGGQLARLAAPARVETLALSDVVGDNLDVIGSGPTAPDHSTFSDARGVLERYGVWRRVPPTVRDRLSDPTLAETPKPGDPIFRGVRNTVIGSNPIALEAAAKQARALGYRTQILSSEITGETREIARMHAAILRECARRKAAQCILSGGETTVTIRGAGLGGRNQEFALAAAIEIAGLPNALVFSAGTDGTDGPTDAAGAVADGSTLARNGEARTFLDRNDSYRYFEALGDLVKTGPTHTNVMDIHIMLLGGRA
jgi:hydroxypyruvate reductase